LFKKQFRFYKYFATKMRILKTGVAKTKIYKEGSFYENMSEKLSGGIAGVKIKIMPESPDANIEEMQHRIKALVEESGGRNNPYEVQPIAFGLKAIIAFFQWPEEKTLEELEQKIEELDHVQSVQVIDMRKIA
jgi:translation elongation factor aEF-1 beta